MFEQSRGSVIKSEVHLTTRHTPEKPMGRDQELDRIGAALRPLTKDHPAEHLLIHGPAGVGKTTCVTHVLSQLEFETNVKTAHLNCWQYNTRPSCITQLLIELGYPAPRKGKPVDELVSKLREWVDRNRSVAVALDEFDQLDAATEVVYDLRQVCEEADHEVGILMVSNQHPTTIDLDPRSESRLTCQTLEFRPYSSGELYDILEQRAEEALLSDAVSESILRSIANHVADESGDCRQALELLLRAARVADQEQCSEVTEEHIERVE